jgi:hypothetical protein
MNMQRRWRALAAPAVLALCLLATACGGSSGASSDGVASAGGDSARKAGADKKTDPEQAGLDFARCMREHGIDMPDPKAGEGGMVMIGGGPGSDAGAGASVAASPTGPPAGFEEAHEACEHHLEGLIGDGPGPMDAEAQDRALKFAQCMRDNGVDMPDPDFSGGGVRITMGAGPGSADFETFKAAQEKCGGAFGPGGLRGVTGSRP